MGDVVIGLASLVTPSRAIIAALGVALVIGVLVWRLDAVRDERDAAEARAAVAEAAADALTRQMAADADITDTVDDIREDLPDEGTDLPPDLLDFLGRLRGNDDAPGGAGAVDGGD